MLQDIKAYALKHNVPIIDDPTRQYIVDLLQEQKPKYCLEIGSAIGYSTVCIAQKIQDRGGTIMWFECSYPSYMKALRTIKRSWLLNIILYYGDFLKFPSHVVPARVDFLFIDAEKTSYLEYYLICKPFLSNQAIVIFDDVIKYKHKTQHLIDYLHTNNISYSIKQLTADDGILILN